MKFSAKLIGGLAIIGASAGTALADDWGCQVLLCLSNPSGPEAYAECVPPIEKLWNVLRHHGSFPVCDMGGGGSGNYATQQWASGSNCPPQYMNPTCMAVDGAGFQYVASGFGFCRYQGSITVYNAGQPFGRVWWSQSGSVMEPLMASASNNDGARQFNADLAAYQQAKTACESQPPSPWSGAGG